MEQLKPQTRLDEKIHRQPPPNSLPDHDAILFHAGRMAETFKAKQVATKAHTKARTLFKNTGITMRIFDLVEDLSQQDDPKAAIDKFVREMVHVAGAFAIVPAATQIDLFNGVNSAVEARDKAFADGRVRGIMGLALDEQAYHTNTDLGQEHLRGWDEGQKVLRDRFVAMNEMIREQDAAAQAKADEKAARKAERAAKKPAEVKAVVVDGKETVQ